MEDFKPNKLWPEDAALFAKMLHEAKTPNEKQFFEKMQYKQEYEYTSAHDAVFLESSNNDGMYMIRVDYDEYLLGKMSGNTVAKSYHFQSLSAVLNSNLKDLGLISGNVTLFDWLRTRDYNNVVYDKDYDYWPWEGDENI